MINSYQVAEKEMSIRDLLDTFPDTSVFKENYDLLIEKVTEFQASWTASGAKIHIENLKTAIEKLEVIRESLNSYIEILKADTLEVTNSTQKREEIILS